MPAARPAPTARGYADREVTQPPNWHGLVVWDMLLNAVTTGLYLVAGVCQLARPDLFTAVTVWAFPLALGVLLVDLNCLVLDLGHKTRFHHMLRVFKPSSPMSLGTWFLTAYSLPLTSIAAIDVLTLLGWLPPAIADVTWLRPALIAVGLPLAFGSGGYKGVLFSTSAQPGWRDARWLGAYHLSSALAIGCGVLLLLCHATGHADAAETLRWPLFALVLVSAFPLVLLGDGLTPVVRRVRWGRWRLIGAYLGEVLPIFLVPLGHPAADAVAVAGLVASAYFVRAVVVKLPHVIHHAQMPATIGG